MFIAKRKLNKILEHLENDSANTTKYNDEKDFYWKCGNANAVNYIRHCLNMEKNINPFKEQQK